MKIEIKIPLDYKSDRIVYFQSDDNSSNGCISVIESAIEFLRGLYFKEES